MIGISSNSAGILLFPTSNERKYHILDIITGEEKEPNDVQYIYSAAQDWKEIDGPDKEKILQKAISEYWLSRAVSLFRMALGGLEESLENRVFEHIEELAVGQTNPDKILNRLLIAPLIDPKSPQYLAKKALSNGFSTVASILDELADLQPLLQRFTDIWLNLDDHLFNQFEDQKNLIWRTILDKCSIKAILKTEHRKDFLNEWNLMTFHYSDPKSRSCISNLGNEISASLYPDQYIDEGVNVTDKDYEIDSDLQNLNELTNFEAFEKVKKQIKAVDLAVSHGKDTKAEKFLRELVESQISYKGGKDHVVKSLCNIAQRSADMFRMDFESKCLNEACRINPSDEWTLIQYGNHLKKIGNYDKALDVFKKVQKLGHSDVALASIADVYTHQGNFTKAICIYQSIPNWNEKTELLSGIADNLRKMGEFDDARKAYDKLLPITEYPDRIMAGIAEIEKKQGRLEKAKQIYQDILDREDLVKRDQTIYRLALCNVLKLMEQFYEAYNIVDMVLIDFPFFMQARFIRGSLLGIIGRELEGLNDIPESKKTPSWEEWTRWYYRGLILLKLDRYEDARKNLVEELSKTLVVGEEKAILRMAAALWFLSKDKTTEAEEILSQLPNLFDCHVQYLSLVL